MSNYRSGIRFHFQPDWPAVCRAPSTVWSERAVSKSALNATVLPQSTSVSHQCCKLDNVSSIASCRRLIESLADCRSVPEFTLVFASSDQHMLPAYTCSEQKALRNIVPSRALRIKWTVSRLLAFSRPSGSSLAWHPAVSVCASPFWSLATASSKTTTLLGRSDRILREVSDFETNVIAYHSTFAS
jgi:hypothetical protein